MNTEAEVADFLKAFNYEEVKFVIGKLRDYYKFFEARQGEALAKKTRNVTIIELNDPEYPDLYKICTEDKKPSKHNEMLQNGKYYPVVASIKIPIDVDYKKIIRSLTAKVPEKGRMKYNYTFHKNKLDEIIDALKG